MLNAAVVALLMELLEPEGRYLQAGEEFGVDYVLILSGAVLFRRKE